ncbi:MAG: response regulator [Bacteroidales bacterium]|nr:response regulator [Bacteroidales bacterium]
MKNILIVDDDLPTRILVSELMQNTVHVIGTGSENETMKFIKITDLSFSLVLMDYFLPDSNGVELYKKLKFLLPGTPFIAISAAVTSEIKFKCIKAGFNGFFTKPFHLDALKKTIISYCFNSRNLVQQNLYKKLGN